MKYYLKGSWETEYREVTREQFIKAERAAGFYPKCAAGDPQCMTTLATGGFAGNGVAGTVKYEEGD